jgi:hypothetical protein
VRTGGVLAADTNCTGRGDQDGGVDPIQRGHSSPTAALRPAATGEGA